MRQVNQVWCRAVLFVVMLVAVGAMGASHARAEELPERLPIESVMRELNARVNYVLKGLGARYITDPQDPRYQEGVWLTWPKCPDGMTPPPKPKDRFYGNTLSDARQAYLVGYLVDQFYNGKPAPPNATGVNIWAHFLNSEEFDLALAANVDVFYSSKIKAEYWFIESDFPKSWPGAPDVDEYNYREAFVVVRDHIDKLTTVADSWKPAIYDEANIFLSNGDAGSDACQVYSDSRANLQSTYNSYPPDNNSWSVTHTRQIGEAVWIGVVEAVPNPVIYEGWCNFSRYRGRLRHDLSLLVDRDVEGDVAIYYKAKPKEDGIVGSPPGGGQGDAWVVHGPASVASLAADDGIYQTPLIADSLDLLLPPADPDGSCEGDYIFGWEVANQTTLWRDDPQFDTEPDAGECETHPVVLDLVVNGQTNEAIEDDKKRGVFVPLVSPSASDSENYKKGAPLQFYIRDKDTNEEVSLSEGVLTLSGKLPKDVVLRTADGTVIERLPYKWEPAKDEPAPAYVEPYVPFDHKKWKFDLDNGIDTQGVLLEDEPDTAWVYAACEACAGGVCHGPYAGGSDAEVNSVDFVMDLGQLDETVKAGRLAIMEASAGASLSTPAVLGVIGPTSSSLMEVVRDGNDWIRQIRTPFSLVDVTTQSSTKYTVGFYYASDAGAWSTDHYDMSNATAYKTIVFEAPGGDTNQLLVTETDTPSGSIKRWLYVYSTVGGDGVWELGKGVDASGTLSGAVSRESVERSDVINDLWSETRTIKRPDGTVLSKVTQTYQQLPWGQEVIESVIDPDGVAHTTSWTYYTEPVADGAAYSQVKSEQQDSGYWEHYIYDSEGQLQKTIMQLGDNAYEPSDLVALEAANVVREEAELSLVLNNGDSEADVVSREQTLVAGSVVQSRYEIDWSGTIDENDTILVEQWDIACRNGDPEQGYADTTAFLNALASDAEYLGNQVSKQFRYADKDALGNLQALAYRSYRMESPDGTVTLYGYNTGGGTTVRRGVPDASGTDVLFGRKTETTVDAAGSVISTKQWSRDGGSWQVVSLELISQTDAFSRPTETEYYFGAAADDPGNNIPAYTTSQTYGCCGVESRTDRAGLVTSYIYDTLGRTTETEGPDGVVMHYSYDALGRTTLTEREASDGSSTLGVSSSTYDLAGRVVQRVTAPNTSVGRYEFYTYRKVKADGSTYDPQVDTGAFYEETRVYPHDQSGGAIQVSWTDSHGHQVRSFSATSGATWNSSTPPTGSEMLAEVSRTVNVYDWAGRISETRTYHDLSGLGLADAGVAGTHYSTATYEYDALGRQIRMTDGAGTITATVYDAAGRAIETWQGTDATDATATDPSGNGASGNNMVKVAETLYDLDYDRDPAENDWRSYATRQLQVRAIQTLTGTASDYTAVDFEQSETASGRVTWTKPAAGAGPWAKQVYDLQGRLVSRETYQNGSTTVLLSKTTQHYDDSAIGGGRLVATRVYESDGSGGVTSNYLETTYSYDDAGRQVKTAAAGQSFSKTAFDVFGRTLRAVTASEEGTTTDVFGVNAFADDVVLTETVYEYDDAGNVLVVTQYDRHHDASGSVRGLLSESINSGKSRVTHTATWYDVMHRPTHVVEYGTNTP